MRFVEISIFHIAQTRVNPAEVQRWLSHLGASYEYRNEISALMDPCEECGGTEGHITDPALLIALAAKRCYNSFEPGLNPNVTKVRKDWTEYLENILQSRHGSVLEHATHSFAFENVSRVFTGEMNRHRAGVAISEASMRYIRYRDIPMWMPDSIRLTPEEEAKLELWGEDYDVQDPDFLPLQEFTEEDRLIIKKWRTQKVFRNALTDDEENYAALQEIWKDELADNSPFKGKKHITSMMRRIIPMGVATGGVWTLNFRALRHIMALRSSPAAEEEILHVWSRAGKEMVEREPMIIGVDFTQTDEGYWVPKYDKV